MAYSESSLLKVINCIPFSFFRFDKNGLLFDLYKNRHLKWQGHVSKGHMFQGRFYMYLYTGVCQGTLSIREVQCTE